MMASAIMVATNVPPAWVKREAPGATARSHITTQITEEMVTENGNSRFIGLLGQEALQEGQMVRQGIPR